MSDGPMTPIGSPGTFEEGMFAATTRCVRSSPALNCPLLIGSAVLCACVRLCGTQQDFVSEKKRLSQLTSDCAVLQLLPT
jgi:hypothetical protein